MSDLSSLVSGFSALQQGASQKQGALLEDAEAPHQAAHCETNCQAAFHDRAIFHRLLCLVLQRKGVWGTRDLHVQCFVLPICKYLGRDVFVFVFTFWKRRRIRCGRWATEARVAAARGLPGPAPDLAKHLFWQQRLNWVRRSNSLPRNLAAAASAPCRLPGTA